ncbi:F-box/FBD/LRR-repeat protein At4g26340 [Brassica rapa]|uniref:F-box/FBD/LRR-repeat protein At4g26340 n=1 Tax=Brassica campestris TaxID=3711 RepID=UPI00142DE0AF|nr:F-box/FBD/LRR-repeat protein At4g26340 [Brassica rapa]
MDMISQLSDDLLIRILSRVPTKHVMATCCLSKRWLRLWSLVPKLDYADCSYSNENYATFTQFVYRSLMSNKAPVLETLDLNLGSKCQAIDVGNWIETAVVCHRVQAIIAIIHPSNERGTMISLPSSMYTCETLETLELYDCFRLDVPFSVRLPSLKTLKLVDVDYADNKVSSLTRLLSGCPNLDFLLVHHDNLDVALMVPPSLGKLIMYNNGRNQKGSGFVIDAPSLVWLYVRDDVLYDFHQIEHMPNLEVAHVEMTFAVRNHKFLKAFTCARSLTLCLSFLEVLSPCGMIFHNLVDLTLNTCAQGWWDLVTRMLQDSPKLRSLKLTDEHQLEFTSIETPESWKRPSSVPECFLHSFEIFEWKGNQLLLLHRFDTNISSLKATTMETGNLNTLEGTRLAPTYTSAEGILESCLYHPILIDGGQQNSNPGPYWGQSSLKTTGPSTLG